MFRSSDILERSNVWPNWPIALTKHFHADISEEFFFSIQIINKLFENFLVSLLFLMITIVFNQFLALKKLIYYIYCLSLVTLIFAFSVTKWPKLFFNNWMRSLSDVMSSLGNRIDIVVTSRSSQVWRNFLSRLPVAEFGQKWLHGNA